MIKIVINSDFGAFRLPESAIAALTACGTPVDEWGDLHDGEGCYVGRIARDNPDLVAVVEALGEQANDLAVVEIPDGVDWVVSEYDGLEHVCEKHRRWYPPKGMLAGRSW